MNTALELLIAIVALPVIALAVGWLFGSNYEPPLIDPEEYVRWGVE
jgi:hypothetical protein